MRRFIGVLFIIIAVPIFLLGIIALISPTGFFWIGSHLPQGLQHMLLSDILLGAAPRSWAYILAGLLLGGVGFFLKGR
jgi:hypothetical protein